MSRSLENRIALLERALLPPEPLTLIVRHFSGVKSSGLYFTDSEGNEQRQRAGESEEQFIGRAPVINGIVLLHEAA